MPLLVPMLSQSQQKKKTGTQIHTHVETHVYIYVWACLFAVCVEQSMALWLVRPLSLKGQCCDICVVS